jgi:hypothetical protein
MLRRGVREHAVWQSMPLRARPTYLSVSRCGEGQRNLRVDVVPMKLPIKPAKIATLIVGLPMRGVVPSGACGTSWHEPFVRDRWGDADFTDACRAHDRCYETCGRNKDDCDHAFHVDLRAECRNAYGGGLEAPLRRICLELANTYHSAVHRNGGDAYRAAQRASGCRR